MTHSAPSTWSIRSLRLALKLALRDLRGNLRSFGVFVACIALGVAAITGVNSLSRSLTEGISNEGRSLIGGDISFALVHRQATETERNFLETKGRVSEVATLRAMARIPNQFDQALVEIKSIDGIYPLYGTLAFKGDVSRDGLFDKKGDYFGVAVEETLLARLDLKVGDQVSIGRSIYDIRAAIGIEPDKLAGRFAIGPRVLMSAAGLDVSELVQPGSLVTWRYRLAVGDGSATMADLGGIISEAREDYPESGWQITSRAQAAPGLRRSIQRFAQFLTLVGFTALIVGGVGIANAVRSYLDKKRRVIATFKSVGAPNGLVFQIYLMEIMAVASIGILVGLVLGSLIPFVAAQFLAGVLPIDAAVSIYPRELLLSVVYGYLTALTFALWPLGRINSVAPTSLFRDSIGTLTGSSYSPSAIASRVFALLLAGISIYLAYDPFIAMYYVVGALFVFILLRFVSDGIIFVAKRLPHARFTSLRMAIANMHRPGALTSSVILSLGLGLTLLVTLALIDGNLRRQLTGNVRDLAPSFFFLDIQNNELSGFKDFLAREAEGAEVQTVPFLRGRIVEVKGQRSDTITASPESAWVLRGDRGITYSETLPENSELVEGKWWDANHSGENLVSFEADLAQGLGLEIGDQITVNVLGRNIKARIANLRKLQWESMAINFVLVFSPNTFAGAPHAHLATIAWSGTPDEAKELSLLRAAARDFPTVTTIRVKEALDAINALVAQLAWAIRGAASVALIASILVLAGALAAGHANRIYDAVVLKTLGATRMMLVGAFGLEYILLGLATAVFSLFAGAIAAWFVVEEIMNIDFVFLPTTAVMAALISLFMTVGFGLAGTWRVLKQKPAPVLRTL